MRFMHLSDVRLGLHTESGRPWASLRVSEVTETLRKLVLSAEEKRIDIVLIAGGLFAHRPVTAELEEVNRVFSAHPGIAFVIIAGDSDRIRKNSPVLSFRWAKNVHYCLDGRGEKIRFPELSTVIYARSLTENPDTCEELIAPEEKDETEEPTPSIRIALVAEPSLEKAAHYSSSGFSYVAFGGIPAFTELEKDRVYYSGGLEPAGMNDTGAHGLIQGEISPATGSVTSLHFSPVASAAYVPLLVKINTSVTPEEFDSMIEEEIQKRGDSNIYRIRITGQKCPGYVFDLARCRDRYRIADILDEAEPRYDFEALFEEHQQDMIGYFISTLRRKHTELPDIDKKAMFQGIDALIRTSEKEGRQL